MCRYLELRSMCIAEPESCELLQLTYLCFLDSQISERALLDDSGGLKNLGMAEDTYYIAKGIYPVKLQYEREGKIKRARENDLTRFEKVAGNVYRPNTEKGEKLVCLMQRKSCLSKKA